MSLVTPTTAQIDANIIAQLEASLNQTIPLLPKAFMRVLAKVLAGVFILLWKYVGFVFLQLFVKTATIEEVSINGVPLSPLKEWGRLIGVGDPIAATQAQMTTQIAVITQGGQLNSGELLVGSSNGITYALVTTILLDAETVLGTIRAVADQAGGNGSGDIGNLVIGETVSFANPLPEVVRDTIVQVNTVTGADQELTAAYRQRIVDRFQKRPQGGALIDYVFWGLEVAGIANIYPYTGDPGEVDVYVESATETDGIPTQAQLDAVAASIALDDDGLASRSPANAFVNTLPITRTAFTVTVVGLTNVGNLAAVQNQINASLEEFFVEREPFISGVTLPPRKDSIAKVSLIGLVEDIVTAANGNFQTVNFVVTGVGVNLFEYILGEGEKAKLTTPVLYA